LNLALHSSKWDDGSNATLAEFEGKALGLLLERSGNAVCFFDWSVRGTPTPAGVTFDLRLPSCPITILELRLPTDAWLTVPTSFGGRLTGPHETETSASRLWRLQVTARSQVEFTVHRLRDTGAPPRVAAHWVNRQLLTPDRLAADFDVQLDA